MSGGGCVVYIGKIDPSCVDHAGCEEDFRARMGGFVLLQRGAAGVDKRSTAIELGLSIRIKSGGRRASARLFPGGEMPSR